MISTIEKYFSKTRYLENGKRYKSVSFSFVVSLLFLIVQLLIGNHKLAHRLRAKWLQIQPIENPRFRFSDFE